METQSYCSAVKTNLHTLSMRTGPEGYVVRISIQLAAIAFTGALATGRLAQPGFLTRLAKGQVYRADTWIKWAGIGIGLGGISGAINFRTIAFASTCAEDKASSDAWSGLSFSKRCYRLADSSIKFVALQALVVGFVLSLSALLSRSNFVPRFWSGVQGLNAGAQLTMMAGSLGGSLLAWNREVTEEPVSETIVIKTI